jgi:hypothetical protein
MTHIWGPLGWMTLHSISLNYPDDPSKEDKAIVNSFIQNFANCITCPSCRSHFSSMFTLYKQRHPEWANSKFNLFLFIARAHNTVNKRLDKPILYTVESCIEAIKRNSKLNSLAVYRENYINHVIRNWQYQVDGESRIMFMYIKEVQKINNEYWNLRETSIDTIIFPEENVIEFIEDYSGRTQNVFTSGTITIPKNVGFKIRGGKLRLGGM